MSDHAPPLILTPERHLLFRCYYVRRSVFYVLRTLAAARPRSKVFTTNYLVKIAVLAAVARVIMLLEFPLPMFPAFLKLDVSDLVPLIGSLSMGPLAGVLIELVKCLIHTLNSTTGGVGDLANFIVGAGYVAAAGLWYKYHRTARAPLWACSSASSP